MPMRHRQHWSIGEGAKGAEEKEPNRNAFEYKCGDKPLRLIAK